MRKSLLFVLVLAMALTMVIGSASTASAAKPAPEGYYCLTSHYYIAVPCVTTWVEAKDYAASLTVEIGRRMLSGHLVTISSERENALVAQILSEMGAESAWIGATDEVTEGTWTWITGERWSYTNWLPGEPNDLGNEDYAQIYPEGRWNDLTSWHTQNWLVVEYENRY